MFHDVLVDLANGFLHFVRTAVRQHQAAVFVHHGPFVTKNGHYIRVEIQALLERTSDDPRAGIEHRRLAGQPVIVALRNIGIGNLPLVQDVEHELGGLATGFVVEIGLRPVIGDHRPAILEQQSPPDIVRQNARSRAGETGLGDVARAVAEGHLLRPLDEFIQVFRLPVRRQAGRIEVVEIVEQDPGIPAVRHCVELSIPAAAVHQMR